MKRLIYLDNLKVCLLVFCLIYALIRQFCKPINGECSSSPTIIGMITTICSFVLTWLVRLIPGAKKVL